MFSLRSTNTTLLRERNKRSGRPFQAALTFGFAHGEILEHPVPFTTFRVETASCFDAAVHFSNTYDLRFHRAHIVHGIVRCKGDGDLFHGRCLIKGDVRWRDLEEIAIHVLNDHMAVPEGIDRASEPVVMGFVRQWFAHVDRVADPDDVIAAVVEDRCVVHVVLSSLRCARYYVLRRKE